MWQRHWNDTMILNYMLSGMVPEDHFVPWSENEEPSEPLK